MNQPLTLKQRNIFNFVREQINTGLPPTIREVSDFFGIKPSIAHAKIEALARKGYLQREGYGMPLALPPYKGKSRYSVVAQQNIKRRWKRTSGVVVKEWICKGDVLVIDEAEPLTAGDIALTPKGTLKRYKTGDAAIGKVVGMCRSLVTSSQFSVTS